MAHAASLRRKGLRAKEAGRYNFNKKGPKRVMKKKNGVLEED